MGTIKYFLSGVGRATNLGIAKKRRTANPMGTFQDDAIALSRDWAEVGGDIRFALDSHGKKTANRVAHV